MTDVQIAFNHAARWKMSPTIPISPDGCYHFFLNTFTINVSVLIIYQESIDLGLHKIIKTLIISHQKKR